MRRVVLALATTATAVLAPSGCGLGGAAPLSAIGSVPVAVVALDGPISLNSADSPMVPVAASALATLMDQMRAAQAGRELLCAPTCWSHAVQPPNSLLVAIQYAVTTCDSLDHVSGHVAGSHVVYVDVRVSNRCHGGGQAQRARDALLAISKSRLPHVDVLTITVRSSFDGDKPAVIGTTRVSLH